MSTRKVYLLWPLKHILLCQVSISSLEKQYEAGGVTSIGTGYWWAICRRTYIIKGGARRFFN